jgi:hypothetical protein
MYTLSYHNIMQDNNIYIGSTTYWQNQVLELLWVEPPTDRTRYYNYCWLSHLLAGALCYTISRSMITFLLYRDIINYYFLPSST